MHKAHFRLQIPPLNGQVTPPRIFIFIFIPHSVGILGDLEHSPLSGRKGSRSALRAIGSRQARQRGSILCRWPVPTLPVSVSSCFLREGHATSYQVTKGRGAYLYVLEGGPVKVNGQAASALCAVMALDEKEVSVLAAGDAKLLLVDVLIV